MMEIWVLHLLAIVDNAALNISVQIYMWKFKCHLDPQREKSNSQLFID